MDGWIDGLVGGCVGGLLYDNGDFCDNILFKALWNITHRLK